MNLAAQFFFDCGLVWVGGDAGVFVFLEVMLALSFGYVMVPPGGCYSALMGSRGLLQFSVAFDS